jgi:plastocyanin
MMRQRWSFAPFAALALALSALMVLAACGATAEAKKDAEAVATNLVTMPKSYRFDPALITVPAGTTVTWTNTDNFTHSVRVAGGATQMVAPGESATFTFDTPGEYAYVCTLHAQNMKGKVIVAAP